MAESHKQGGGHWPPAPRWARCPAHVRDPEPQWPGRASRSLQHRPWRGPWDHAPKLGTSHGHLMGRGHSTASLGGSRGRQLRGVTAPAPTTCYKGKLRHDGFKHTSTGQAWPCALPGTITSTIPGGMVPRGTIPRGMVRGGTTSKEAQHPEVQYNTQRHDIQRDPIPRGTISKKNDLWKHDATGGRTPRKHDTQMCDTKRPNIRGAMLPRLKMHKDAHYSRKHSTQQHDIPRHDIPGGKISKEAQYPVTQQPRRHDVQKHNTQRHNNQGGMAARHLLPRRHDTQRHNTHRDTGRVIPGGAVPEEAQHPRRCNARRGDTQTGGWPAPVAPVLWWLLRATQKQGQPGAAGRGLWSEQAEHPLSCSLAA